MSVKRCPRSGSDTQLQLAVNQLSHGQQQGGALCMCTTAAHTAFRQSLAGVSLLYQQQLR
jgi:hypothetical protein